MGEPDEASGTGGHSAGMDMSDMSLAEMSSMPGMPFYEAPAESEPWNTVDASYLSMMVAHHSQAIDMTELAERYARNPQVRTIASAIDSGQGREIIVMATWLVDHDIAEPTVESVAEMTEHGMPGMLTPEEVVELGETRGAAFDRLFLTSMIRHHEGAISMAEDQLSSGEDVLVSEMANDVLTSQRAEIDRMNDVLADLA